MPRVTAEYRAARREQILRAALRCVARQGFHKSTMADVISESGLSAGAVYGYFKSKDDIVKAIAERSIGTVDETFLRSLDDGAVPHPADVLQAALEGLLTASGSDDVDVTVIAVQAWGEAVRGGEIQDLVAPRIRALREHWIEVVRRFQAAGHLDPAADPELVGRALLALIPGFIVQRLVIGGVSPAGFATAVHAMLDSSGHPNAAGR